MVKDEDVFIPISEIFLSPQGEGVYAGQMQVFVRTAGCTVGKRYPEEMYKTFLGEGHINSKALPMYTEKCTFADGREFPCDTDYRSHGKLTPEDLIHKIFSFKTQDVCFTGGEPLMHQRRLKSVLKHLQYAACKIHIETSGTIEIDEYLDDIEGDFWITVSPKKNVLPSMVTRANEIKLLVNAEFAMNKLPFDAIGLAITKPVFLQPVNYEHTVNAENLRMCLELQKKYTMFRVSPQMHKVMSQYTTERIR